MAKLIAFNEEARRGLEAGMNNYLAKPVRADMLKQMLESYLHQPAKNIANLQQEANHLVNTVVGQADRAPVPDGDVERPRPPLVHLVPSPPPGPSLPDPVPDRARSRPPLGPRSPSVNGRVGPRSHVVADSG